MKDCLHYRTSLLAIFAFSASSIANAAADPTIVYEKNYACTGSVPASGLNWDGNRWEAMRFPELGRFTLKVLVIDDGRNQQFIHFNIKDDAKEVHCGAPKQANLFGLQSCSQNGMNVLFSETNERGGISYLLGATSKESTRDSLAVVPFNCQAF